MRRRNTRKWLSIHEEEENKPLLRRETYLLISCVARGGGYISYRPATIQCRLCWKYQMMKKIRRKPLSYPAISATRQLIAGSCRWRKEESWRRLKWKKRRLTCRRKYKYESCTSDESSKKKGVSRLHPGESREEKRISAKCEGCSSVAWLKMKGKQETENKKTAKYQISKRRKLENEMRQASLEKKAASLSTSQCWNEESEEEENVWKMKKNEGLLSYHAWNEEGNYNEAKRRRITLSWRRRISMKPSAAKYDGEENTCGRNHNERIWNENEKTVKASLQHSGETSSGGLWQRCRGESAALHRCAPLKSAAAWTLAAAAKAGARSGEELRRLEKWRWKINKAQKISAKKKIEEEYITWKQWNGEI